MQAEQYCFAGADALFIYNYSKMEKEREEFLAALKQIAAKIDIPFITGMYVGRFEDAKKAFYTGAEQVVVKYEICPAEAVLKEVTGRFGADKIVVEIDGDIDFDKVPFPVDTLLIKHVDMDAGLERKCSNAGKQIIIRDSLLRNDLESLLRLPNVCGVSTNYFLDKEIFKIKMNMKQAGIEMNTFESAMDFSEFKTDEKGLIPCITQDYKTGEVLQLAYMNQQSYEATCSTGKMTYFSRSRQELWCKGETSGHYQYVKELRLDCDHDTVLAKVHQVGAACHTGARSCFFNELAKKEYNNTNPLTILNEVFATIEERKAHPKEGSYTNYLFEKGIDKILKKCGEEATEIVIAAKNPDAEELKYEIADFLYHMMVLMAECGLNWDDVVKELANRH
ncbi:MAG: bifunctional phosphoribosyl-AMP cyclohydrolase/phosphoribosyl-ATP diphosphatase HisIE [Eubacterium sp.]|nr:bifunctional phosphoribosyl-AMP cyclohydrolase/phosphoribosyl-ATP diphosphatase HisIE [Eubacterium sp.]MCI9411614.1 bifunctional phosphoribosyl-AMP cyclohydrolase/phosphoribosyl-ATP diphosphatase HisIE [Eubacterium sp.]